MQLVATTDLSELEKEIRRLSAKYADRLRTNPVLQRRLVSFQTNKHIPFYRWFRYKEGFSAPLVRKLIGDVFGASTGRLLDPFAGSGAALFAARELGWETVGIELLPVGVFAIQARIASERVDTSAFENAVRQIFKKRVWTLSPDGLRFSHLKITQNAFSPETEKEICAYLAYCERDDLDSDVRTLLKFACFAILESVSFTRKDGQYLRWDYRAGRSSSNRRFDKGAIPSFEKAISIQLEIMLRDMKSRTTPLLKMSAPDAPYPKVIEGSCLEILPTLRERFDLVFTSPPYCNRYDYTRTYALELAFLGSNDQAVRSLRQAMLSCTVENREKIDALRETYSRCGASEVFRQALAAFENQRALQLILRFLDELRERGELNNANIPRMVRNYFVEMAVTVFALAGLLREGGVVIMVNDNVRYAGQEVPVDLILSDFAEKAGLDVERIWTLPIGKGNSSQQMGAFGRSELRKCVYIWRKGQCG